MSDEYGYGDPESISFVGHVSSPPEPVIDFDQPIWQVDFHIKGNVVMVAVNAATERDAVAAAISKAQQQGINTITVEEIQVTRLETLTDG